MISRALIVIGTTEILWSISGTYPPRTFAWIIGFAIVIAGVTRLLNQEAGR